MKILTAAIQFGSSRICAAAAKISENGSYEVIAIESVPTLGCLQYGCVTNIDETAQRIKSLMQKLSNRVMGSGFRALQSAYIGLCGISMHSMEYQPTMILNEDQGLTDEVIHQLQQKSLNLNLPDYDILGMRDNGCTVEGEMAKGHHQLILANHRLKQGITQAMERAHIGIAGFLATPLLLGDILTTEEKQVGCLLLDMGAKLTSISIYKEGQLRFLTVMPLGCDSVTYDIASLGMRVDEAEDLKRSWSDASNPSVDQMHAPSLPNAIDIKELNIITTSRYEEIVANIQHQVEKAGYIGLLEGGCIITGGASVQKGLTTLLSRRLEMGRISTRSCNTIRYSNSERKPHLASLMSMLSYCTASCEAPKKAEPVAPPKDPTTEVKKPIPMMGERPSQRKKTGIRDFFGDLFSGLDE
ncbi:MAG: hypothetical protein J6Y99_07805 [Bacteroidales bacterium]|nr:hypothetical protein [Bacteroidales bacterium]